VRRCEFVTLAGEFAVKDGPDRAVDGGRAPGCCEGGAGHSSGRGQAGRSVQETERTVERSQDE